MGLLDLKLTIGELRFDNDRFTQAMRAGIRREMKEAMRALLVAMIPRIPQYTGAAMGTLIPIGRFLHVAIDINPAESARRKSPWRTAQDGADMSAFRFYDDNNGKVGAEFTTDLPYFLANDYGRADTEQQAIQQRLTNPVPWGAIEAGREAYREYLRANLMTAVPRIQHFISITQRKFND